jgi:hypothetical protein
MAMAVRVEVVRIGSRRRRRASSSSDGLGLESVASKHRQLTGETLDSSCCSGQIGLAKQSKTKQQKVSKGTEDNRSYNDRTNDTLKDRKSQQETDMPSI